MIPVLLVLAIVQASHGQTFQVTYDDANTYASVSQSVRQTRDGGYITTGYSMIWGTGTTKVLLSKSTSTGALVWMRELGSAMPSAGVSEAGFAVREVIESGVSAGYIVVGMTRELSFASQVLVIRTDVNGTPLWRHIYPGGSGEGVGYNVEVLPELFQGQGASFIVTGYMDAQIVNSVPKGQRAFLMRLNNVGAVTWIRKYGVTTGQGMEEANVGFDVFPFGSGFVMTGYCNPSGLSGGSDKRPFVVCTDGAGMPIWQNIYTLTGLQGVFGDRYAIGKTITSTNDGGLVVSGPVQTYTSTGLDFFLMKLNALGAVQWIDTYDGYDPENESSYQDAVYDMYKLPEGNFVLAGFTDYVESGTQRTMLAKIDSRGQPLWAHKYTFRTIGDPYIIPGIDEEIGITLDLCSDGGSIIESNPYPNNPNGFYLIKTTSTGLVNGCENPIILDRIGQEATVNPMPLGNTVGDRTVLTRSVYDWLYYEDWCSLTPKRSFLSESVDSKWTLSSALLRSGEPLLLRAGALNADAKISVVNTLGQVVYSSDLSDGATGREITVGTDGWVPGKYFVRISTGKTIERHEVIIIR